MASNKELIEYQIRDVSRYIITRYQTGPTGGLVETKGEYDNRKVAFEVAYALCKSEHQQLGWEPGDNRIQYPVEDTPADC